MADKNFLDVSVYNGKYRVIISEAGEAKALRYNEEWRDLCGDNLVYWLAVEIEGLREIINKAKNCLVCDNQPAEEICGNTLEILEKG